jgi:hypothetical protein
MMITRLRRKPDESWRWLALLSVLISIFFVYLSQGMMASLPTIAEVSQKYPTMFSPAGYAFSIWGAIYLSMLIYAIYQVLPSQRDEILFDRLAKPLIVVNLLAVAWIVSFRFEMMSISVLVIVGMLAASVIMLERVRDEVLRGDCSNWVSVPFSLLSGWLSVATIANVAILLVSLELQGSQLVQSILTILMITVASLLGVMVCFRCRDFIFPAVIMWACVAIFFARQADYLYMGAVALVGAMLPAIWIATTLIRRISHRHRVWSNKLYYYK